MTDLLQSQVLSLGETIANVNRVGRKKMQSKKILDSKKERLDQSPPDKTSAIFYFNGSRVRGGSYRDDCAFLKSL